MKELEQIVNLCKCDILDALTYLNNRTAFYIAVQNNDKNLKQYQENYTNSSDVVYSKLNAK